jgi:hypothetical protein
MMREMMVKLFGVSAGFGGGCQGGKRTWIDWDGMMELDWRVGTIVTDHGGKICWLHGEDEESMDAGTLGGIDGCCVGV